MAVLHVQRAVSACSLANDIACGWCGQHFHLRLTNLRPSCALLTPMHVVAPPIGAVSRLTEVKGGNAGSPHLRARRLRCRQTVVIAKDGLQRSSLRSCASSRACRKPQASCPEASRSELRALAPCSWWCLAAAVSWLALATVHWCSQRRWCESGCAGARSAAR